nr:hypothetical protein [Tanacetum cinerariifolium]
MENECEEWGFYPACDSENEKRVKWGRGTGHTKNYCSKKNKPQDRNASGRDYMIKDVDKQGPNVVTVNHLFKIDLVPIELGTFDVRIDWLAKHDDVIICGKKVVRIPCGNKTLIVEGDKAHVTKKKLKEKCLEDVPVIHDFLEEFPDDFLVLPPPRQVEF